MGDLLAPFLLLAVLLSLGMEGGCSNSQDHVPVGLSDIEGLAEDAYDMALVADFSSVADDATQIDSSWAAFRDQASSDGADDADIAAMDAAIPALVEAAGAADAEIVSVARAANAVSGPMANLYALYAPTVPTNILELDYLGREVVLDGMESDYAAASVDIEAVQSTWDAVRDEVIAAGGQAAADDYDANLVAIRSAISDEDAQQIIDQANAGLELVDEMEGVF